MAAGCVRILNCLFASNKLPFTWREWRMHTSICPSIMCIWKEHVVNETKHSYFCIISASVWSVFYVYGWNFIFLKCQTSHSGWEGAFQDNSPFLCVWVAKNVQRCCFCVTLFLLHFCGYTENVYGLCIIYCLCLILVHIWFLNKQPCHHHSLDIAVWENPHLACQGLSSAPRGFPFDNSLTAGISH